MKIIAFFNNKAGVGKTSLCYHLAWIFSEIGVNVIAADLDPQANLTSMFLEDRRLIDIWPDGEHPQSIQGAIRPVISGLGDIAQPHLEIIKPNLGILNGDLGLSGFEDRFSEAWPKCLDRDEAAFRVISSVDRLIKKTAAAADADLALIDVGPNLGALNRAATIAAQYIVIPLAPDLYSLLGLRILGPTLRQWREEWMERRKRNPDPDLPLPSGEMTPIGYVVMQQSVRSSQPMKASSGWMERIPSEHRRSVLDEPAKDFEEIEKDPQCLALLKHSRSLMPMAMEARKPMFKLTPADGAIGGHTQAVNDCYQDFKRLAERIAQQCRITLP